MFAAMRAPAARRFAGSILRPMIKGSLVFTMALAVGDKAILRRFAAIRETTGKRPRHPRAVGGVMEETKRQDWTEEKWRGQ